MTAVVGRQKFLTADVELLKVPISSCVVVGSSWRPAKSSWQSLEVQGNYSGIVKVLGSRRGALESSW